MAGQKKPEHPKRKLRVIAQNQISSGEKDGKAWTLWGYTVQDENGVDIDAKFKGFNDLAEVFGKVVEFGVEHQEHEKYGVSYMLHPPKRDMKKSLDELRDRVSALEHEVGELKKMIGGAPSPPAPASPRSESEPAEEKPLGAREPDEGPRPGDTAEERFGGDDDIPF